ncbi:spore germination protein [Bacillus tianshenii]|uniref:spore germination protein n=1 Tax=Sutcliffiella tianshenii TaxID=1463404 RepID=UPI001CD3DA53|nr:spore germination protein [Bacillus tianshenii]MCA1319291.1 spore germination protein [Bacillus tianshenii]
MTQKEPTGVLSTNLDENIMILREAFVHSEDFVVDYTPYQEKDAYLIYIESITERKIIEQEIIKPIHISESDNVNPFLPQAFIKETNSIKEISKFLLEGNSILLQKDNPLAMIYQSQLLTERNITEPGSETIIRGSHEGFVETLSTNIYLIRKRLQNPKLKIKYFSIGNDSHTKVAMIYLDHLANGKTVGNLEKRLSDIDTDFILAPGHIEEYISDNMSIFPTLISTERPDRTVANLMDGRIAIIADNSPSALIAPVTFFSFFQSPDDYNSRWYFGSFIRFLRIMGFLITIALPATYIAIVSYHYEVLPTEIVVSIKSSLEYVPYPPLVEALAMQITLEILREASIRLPNPIAQTIGVVGGLVIGTAVVEANLVSNTMIIVVAITAISSFVVPIPEMGSSIRLLGFPFMILASLFGFIGMSFFLMFVLIHLCKLESFGTPFFAPFSTLRFSEIKDTIIRTPLPFFKSRPSDTQPRAKKKTRT